MSEAQRELCARRAHVRGLVQGVAFRWHAKQKADELGLCGWIRNLPDGRVETCFEGTAAATRAFRDWLSRGPRAAQVRGLDLWTTEPVGWASFEIVHTEPRAPLA